MLSTFRISSVDICVVLRLVLTHMRRIFQVIWGETITVCGLGFPRHWHACMHACIHKEFQQRSHLLRGIRLLIYTRAVIRQIEGRNQFGVSFGPNHLQPGFFIRLEHLNIFDLQLSTHSSRSTGGFAPVPTPLSLLSCFWEVGREETEQQHSAGLTYDLVPL